MIAGEFIVDKRIVIEAMQLFFDKCFKDPSRVVAFEPDMDSQPYNSTEKKYRVTLSNDAGKKENK